MLLALPTKSDAICRTPPTRACSVWLPASQRVDKVVCLDLLSKLSSKDYNCELARL